MTGNKALYCGKKKQSSSKTHQISRKTELKHAGGSCSTKVTKTSKSGGFVNARNGKVGHKEEVNYKSSYKVKDKTLGCTTKYETQVKHKEVTTYNKKPTPKSGKGKCMCNKVIASTKPGKSSGGVKLKMVTNYTSPSKGWAGSGSRSYGSSMEFDFFPF